MIDLLLSNHVLNFCLNLDIDPRFGKIIEVRLPARQQHMICVVVAKSVEDDIVVSLKGDCYVS